MPVIDVPFLCIHYNVITTAFIFIVIACVRSYINHRYGAISLPEKYTKCIYNNKSPVVGSCMGGEKCDICVVMMFLLSFEHSKYIECPTAAFAMILTSKIATMLSK